MAKQPVKVQSLRLPEPVWAAIEAYRKEVGAVTLADTLRRLLSAGLRAEKREMTLTGKDLYP